MSTDEPIESENPASELVSAENKKSKQTKSPSSHVRFSEEQYAKITVAAERSRMSIPELLKRAYFEGGALRVLMDRDLSKSWYGELKRWGSNLNQLTRKLNSGEYAGWVPELEQIAKHISKIENMLMEVYGRS